VTVSGTSRNAYFFCQKGERILSDKKVSKLEKWRVKYASLAVALGCLYSVVASWGENWVMTALLLAGVIICGTIAFFDLKRIFNKNT
jgi:hypothetical protein